MASSVLELMRISPVIPVIVINKIEQAAPLARALVAGGLKVLEVTLRTEHGLEAIRTMVNEVPGAIVGAGTVLTPQQVTAVVDAGAEFLVTPGSTPKLVEAALKAPIQLLPGVATVSEAMALLEYGIEQMKFFPAEAAGGSKMLKAIYGPLPGITFCPTGGISADSASEYLGLPNVACVGGTWMVPPKLIEAEDWHAIEQLALAAAALRAR